MNFDDILKDFEKGSEIQKQSTEQDRANDLAKLTQTWVKERTIPELLPYESELLDRMLERVRKQIEYIELNSIELQQGEEEIKLLLVLVENELDRVQFLIRSYVRARLQKIDDTAIFLRSDEQELSKLSPDETVYMEKHLELLMELFNSQFLSNMPESLQALDEEAGGISMVTQPEYERPIFVKCLRDHSVIVNNEEIELSMNSIYVMRYSAVRELVGKGEVLVI